MYNEKLLSAYSSPLVTLVEIGEACGTFGTQTFLVGKCLKESKEESYHRLEDDSNADRQEVWKCGLAASEAQWGAGGIAYSVTAGFTRTAHAILRVREFMFLYCWAAYVCARLPQLDGQTWWLTHLMSSHLSSHLIYDLKWPRGLGRGSAAACLLGLRVRMPAGLWMSVSCEWCVLSLRRVDNLSREVLTSVAWLIVIPKPQHWGDLSPLGLSIPRKIGLNLVIYTLRVRVYIPRV